MGNKVGTASKGPFAAVWGAGTQCVNIYWAQDFKSHRKALTDAAAAGECPEFPVAVHAFPAAAAVSDPDAYVREELDQFIAEDGDAYIAEARFLNSRS